MRLAVLCVAFGLFLISDVEAQRNCSKGKPCGNSCIARDKVCRIGGSQPPPPPAAARPLAAVAPVTAPAVADSGLSIPAGDSLWPWIALRGSRPGDPYYSTRVTCFYSKGFKPEQRIYFRTVQEAEAYGLVRTTNPDCG